MKVRHRIEAGSTPDEQQAQHAGGEDVGLAGPRRRRQRRMVARLRGAQLVAFEDGERAEAVGPSRRTLAAGAGSVTLAAGSEDPGARDEGGDRDHPVARLYVLLISISILPRPP